VFASIRARLSRSRRYAAVVANSLCCCVPFHGNDATRWNHCTRATGAVRRAIDPAAANTRNISVMKAEPLSFSAPDAVSRE
jgi:hypothetical protein